MLSFLPLIPLLNESDQIVLMPCRVSSLQYLSQCDIVLYMKNGIIAERGTYDELISNNGVNSAL